MTQKESPSLRSAEDYIEMLTAVDTASPRKITDIWMDALNDLSPKKFVEVCKELKLEYFGVSDISIALERAIKTHLTFSDERPRKIVIELLDTRMPILAYEISRTIEQQAKPEHLRESVDVNAAEKIRFMKVLIARSVEDIRERMKDVLPHEDEETAKQQKRHRELRTRMLHLGTQLGALMSRMTQAQSGAMATIGAKVDMNEWDIAQLPDEPAFKLVREYSLPNIKSERKEVIEKEIVALLQKAKEESDAR